MSEPEIKLQGHVDIKKAHEIRIDDNKIIIDMNNDEIIFSLIIDMSFVKYMKRFKHDEFRKKCKIPEEKDLLEIFNDLISCDYEIDENEKKIIFIDENEINEIKLEEEKVLTNEEMIGELFIEIKNIIKEKY